jgi:hypothetical protein
MVDYNAGFTIICEKFQLYSLLVWFWNSFESDILVSQKGCVPLNKEHVLNIELLQRCN